MEGCFIALVVVGAKEQNEVEMALAPLFIFLHKFRILQVAGFCTI
jgi:hypothetical protein